MQSATQTTQCLANRIENGLVKLEVPNIDLYPKFLIVEDDITIRPLIEHIVLKTDPKAVIMWARTGEAAEALILRRLAQDRLFDVVISDVFLSGQKTGIDLWNQFAGRNIRFLLISGLRHTRFRQMVGDGNGYPMYIQKPINPDECIETLKLMLRFPEHY